MGHDSPPMFHLAARRPPELKGIWQHVLLRSLISNLKSDLTSEAVWRLQWPQRLSKWLILYKQYAHG